MWILQNYSVESQNKYNKRSVTTQFHEQQLNIMGFSLSPYKTQVYSGFKNPACRPYQTKVKLWVTHAYCDCSNCKPPAEIRPICSKTNHNSHPYTKQTFFTGHIQVKNKEQSVQLNVDEKQPAINMKDRGTWSVLMYVLWIINSVRKWDTLSWTLIV